MLRSLNAGTGDLMALMTAEMARACASAGSAASRAKVERYSTKKPRASDVSLAVVSMSEVSRKRPRLSTAGKAHSAAQATTRA